MLASTHEFEVFESVVGLVLVDVVEDEPVRNIPARLAPDAAVLELVDVLPEGVAPVLGSHVPEGVDESDGVVDPAVSGEPSALSIAEDRELPAAPRLVDLAAVAARE